MTSLILLLLPIFLLFVEAQQNLNDDVLGLIVFKSGVEDPLSHLSSWSEEDDTPCSWIHVACSHASGRVTELHLDGLGLSGRIGKGLRKLQELQILSLSGNNFTGNISPEKISLPTESLRFLDLSRNSLSGGIAENLVNASVIRDVDFSGNELSGVLPESLFDDCSSLRSLSIARNFLEGSLPSTLSKCGSLNSLDVSGNKFTGSFLSGLWSLPRIRTLDLSGNFFSGPVPSGVSALHYLERLSFRGNQFSGEIPADIGLCPHLTVAEFGENRFYGGIPESLRRLGLLSDLSLSKNLFSGELPRWIGEMESVNRLDLSGNKFTGAIPATIGGMKSLEFFSISDNELSGAIPSSLGDCSNLAVVRLSRNSLNGSIPESLFDLALEEADLSGNRVSGEIPAGSSKLFESLRRLDLSRNELEGEIPAETGLFSGLEYLNLSWNSLRSEIPPEIGLFRNLTVLDLRENRIYGPLPGEICDSGSLDVLQLDGNRLTGRIPDELGNCSSLSLLSLSHNNLSGLIPKTICKMNKLKILRLEFNELDGEIPKELGKMQSLLAVNVSYNRLVGRLPSGQAFQSLDQSSLQGNLGICSPLLKGPCKLDVPKPLVLDPNAVPYDPRRRHSSNEDEEEEEYHRNHISSAGKQTILSVSAMIAISAAALITIGVLVVSLLSASARKKLAFVEEAVDSMCSLSSRSGGVGASSVGKLVLFGSSSQASLVDPAMLLDKASVIGEGSSGTVYKVSLDSQVVAMKKLANTATEHSVGDFDREVRSLARAQHPNLACLKGYYWTPQVQVLVSEYASEGSLESKLQSCRAHSGQALPWASRFKIIAGIAKGLAHLHHSVRPAILHYNLKPTNVLLDQSLNPKLSDFGGLTKLRSGGGFGYAAPEMACRGMRVDEKCDVYGFGALTLELVTGRKPVEYGEDSVVIASDQVRALVEEGRASECVDRSMGDFPEEEVFPVLNLALVSTSQLPSARPSMPEVLHILHVINTPLPQRIDFML